MATVADTVAGGSGDGALSQTIDRWIYVFMAASFVVIALVGFIPDSVGQMAAIRAGARSPFPAVAHVHALFMGSFLLLLLAQTVLVATDLRAFHRSLGLTAFALVPAIVLAGLALVVINYHGIWQAGQSAAPDARLPLQQLRLMMDNIMLFQLRIGFLFPILMAIGLSARRGNPGLHKRMMILAPAVALPAAIDRMHWLPTTFPGSPLATDLYMLLAISPLFIWDLVRNRGVHPAYLIWLAAWLPFTVAVNMLWETNWWHMVAPRLIGL
jgi:hypothetical protein